MLRVTGELAEHFRGRTRRRNARRQARSGDDSSVARPHGGRPHLVRGDESLGAAWFPPSLFGRVAPLMYAGETVYRRV